jgi:thymidylate synthase (FAD)
LAIFTQQSADLICCPSREDALRFIESAGRTSYKSESTGEPAKFVKMLIYRGHLSVLEHCSATFRFITDRGVTHEMVRHRIAAFTQESTRYCNYASDRFGNELTFVIPVEYVHDDPNYTSPAIEQWKRTMWILETAYLEMIHNGASPQLARSVLPNSLKTEIVMTANFREWMHVFSLRRSKEAHPQMRALMNSAYAQICECIPDIFPPESSQ